MSLKQKRITATTPSEQVSTQTETPLRRGPGRPKKEKAPPKKKDSSSVAHEAAEPPKKRGPGRPRKHPLPESTEPVEPPPRKRGRPPKDKSPETSISPAPPRKRGRPRKKPSPEEPPIKKKKKLSPASPDSDEPKRRGPGRPPKKMKGPGRPPKKNSDSSRSRSPAPKKVKQEDEALEAKPTAKATKTKDNAAMTPVLTSKPPPVKVSRSGRAVKRTSFHDEIDEGEQHLKSSRYAEMQRKAEAAAAAAEAQAEVATQQEENLVEANEGHQDLQDAPEQPGAAPSGANRSADHFYGGVEHQYLEHDVDPHFLDSMPDVADMQQHLGVTLDDNFGMSHDAEMSQPLMMMEPMHMQIEVSKKLEEPAQVGDVSKEGPLSDERKPAPVTESLPTAEPTANLASHCAAPVKVDVSTPAPSADPLTTQAPIQQEPAIVPAAANAPRGNSMETNGLPKSTARTATDPTPVRERKVVALASAAPSQSAKIEQKLPALSSTAPEPSIEDDQKLPALTTAAPAPSVESDQMMIAVAAGGSSTHPVDVKSSLGAAVAMQPAPSEAAVNDPSQAYYNSASISDSAQGQPAKVPRRKPGARECMQISRRFGVNVIPEKWMDTLLVGIYLYFMGDCAHRN